MNSIYLNRCSRLGKTSSPYEGTLSCCNVRSLPSTLTLLLLLREKTWSLKLPKSKWTFLTRRVLAKALLHLANSFSTICCVIPVQDNNFTSEQILVWIWAPHNFPNSHYHDFVAYTLTSTLENNHSNFILRGAERKHRLRHCGIWCEV